MSFGFSASDIVGLARITYNLYKDFQEAGKKYEAFAEDLRTFHCILYKAERVFEAKHDVEDDIDRTELRDCLHSCRHLIMVEICGGEWTQENVTNLQDRFGLNDLHPIFMSSSPCHEYGSKWRTLRDRLREMKFVQQIPRFRQQISSHINQLTLLGILEMEYTPDFIIVRRSPLIP